MDHSILCEWRAAEKMAKILDAPLYCLIWTFVSTLIVFLISGISIITIVVFSTGIIVSTINFVEDEYNYYKKKNEQS